MNNSISKFSYNCLVLVGVGAVVAVTAMKHNFCHWIPDPFCF